MNEGYDNSELGLSARDRPPSLSLSYVCLAGARHALRSHCRTYMKREPPMIHERVQKYGVMVLVMRQQPCSVLPMAILSGTSFLVLIIVIHVRTCIHTHTHIYIYIYTHTYIHTHNTYTYIYIYTYIYTHTCYSVLRRPHSFRACARHYYSSYAKKTAFRLDSIT